MNSVIVFTLTTVLVHVMVFLGETVFWLKPSIYEKVVAKINASKEVGSFEQAKILEVLFFNQGFYNLFLALGGIAGILLFRSGKTQAGIALISYTCLFAFCAGVVLAFSSSAIPAAVVQGLPPLLAILSLILISKQSAST